MLPSSATGSSIASCAVVPLPAAPPPSPLHPSPIFPCLRLHVAWATHFLKSGQKRQIMAQSASCFLSDIAVIQLFQWRQRYRRIPYNIMVYCSTTQWPVVKVSASRAREHGSNHDPSDASFAECVLNASLCRIRMCEVSSFFRFCFLFCLFVFVFFFFPLISFVPRIPI